jgi:alkylation response protein AidB-like acyl-CoA dehydrogenase
MPFSGPDRRTDPVAPSDRPDFVALARGLRPELEAAAPAHDARRELAPEVVERLIEHGFYRMALPRALGGAELDLASYARTIEALAMGDGSTAWCVGQASGCAMSAAYLGEEAAAKVFADRRAVVAWGQGPGKAVACPGGYRLSGRFVFASGISGTRPGPAPTCPSSKRTGRRRARAGGARRGCAPCSSRAPRPGSSMSGT